jgi:hypothetical protein
MPTALPDQSASAGRGPAGTRRRSVAMTARSPDSGTDVPASVGNPGPARCVGVSDGTVDR